MDMATNMDLLWNLDRPNRQITIRIRPGKRYRWFGCTSPT